MPRLLAIDWDTTEARYILADARGAQLSIESAAAVALAPATEQANARMQLAEALRTALGGKASRATVLACIGRSQVELVSLTVPPSSDVELPDLVRNLAMRENSAIAEDAALDFVAVGDPAQPRQVTAVSLAKTRLDSIQAALADAGVSPKVLGMRPYAAAALVLASVENRKQHGLVVHVLPDEVDLVVLSGGQVVFWRTVRQANVSHDHAAAGRLVADVKRTLLVAQPQLAGESLETAWLCGALDEHPALMEAWREPLELPLVVLDPLAGQAMPAGAAAHAGRFAALVGMLKLEAAGEAQAIDFLHPRKRPAPPDRRRTYALMGAAAALLLLFGGYHVWSQFAEIDEEIAMLSDELDLLNQQFKRASQKSKAIQAIETWTKSDVNWLDELRDLSLRFPSGRDAVVTRMALRQGRDSAGAIDLTGVVRDPVVVSRIENNLRDVHHQISSRHMQEQLKDNNYSWHFESSIVVAPRTAQHYVSHLPGGALSADESAERTSVPGSSTPAQAK